MEFGTWEGGRVEKNKVKADPDDCVYFAAPPLLAGQPFSSY
jgi:hypothetical protein